VSGDEEERAALVEAARGDIPPQFCRVVDVEISGDAAHVWLVTDAGGSGGFQTGTPDRVMKLADGIERGEA
jgi:hypothetical protein